MVKLNEEHLKIYKVTSEDVDLEAEFVVATSITDAINKWRKQIKVEWPDDTSDFSTFEPTEIKLIADAIII